MICPTMFQPKIVPEFMHKGSYLCPFVSTFLGIVEPVVAAEGYNKIAGACRKLAGVTRDSGDPARCAGFIPDVTDKHNVVMRISSGGCEIGGFDDVKIGPVVHSPVGHVTDRSAGHFDCIAQLNMDSDACRSVRIRNGSTFKDRRYDLNKSIARF